jgi:hypothetical protein
LKEYDIWGIIDKVVPSLTDPQALAAHEKKDIKYQWEILDVVKVHFIPHLFKNNMAKEMFDALVSLF